VTSTIYGASILGSFANRFYINGYDNNSCLLDIPFVHLANILGLVSSIEFIPESFVARIRRCYISYLEDLCNSPLDGTHWKKVLLLPTILLTTHDKSIIKSRLDLLDLNNWTDFTLGSITKRTVPSTSVSGDTDSAPADFQFKRMAHLIAGSNLSAAMHRLGKQDYSLPTLTTLTQLKSKHPPRNAGSISREDLLSLRSFSIGSDGIFATIGTLRTSISNSKRLVKHGIDKLRYEHLRDLVGHSPEATPDQLQFSELLTHLINLLINGSVPEEVLPFLADNELIAIPKINDIRPVGMGGVLRKLASSVVFNATQAEFNKAFFGATQLALHPAGTEDIVHAFSLVHQTHPDWDIFAVDADNAFNTANRLKTLTTIQAHYPRALPLMLQMYLKESNGWVFGPADGISNVPSSEGFHQGDVLATWAYCVGLQPLLLRVTDLVREEFGNTLASQILIKFYVDDGNIAAPHHVMIRIIEHFQTYGPEFGYFFKNHKGKYLLGKCGSFTVASERKAALARNFGISNSIIVCHPDDCPHDAVTSTIYGASILGSFIGTENYVQVQLQLYLEELISVGNQLLQYPDIQGRMILFRKCFCSKPIHIFRTIPPAICRNFTTCLEHYKQSFLQSTIDALIDPTVYSWMQLDINQGGLGINNYANTSIAAYAASFLTFSLQHHNRGFAIQEACNSIVHTGVLPPTTCVPPAIDHFLGCLLHLGFDTITSPGALEEVFVLSDTPGAGSLQSHFHRRLTNKAISDLLTTLPSHKIAWLTSLQNPVAGSWLDTTPKNLKFKLSNPDFISSLKYRYMLPLSAHVAGIRCDCCRNGQVDALGHHFATGCRKYGLRIRTHDALVFELNSLLHYAGYRTKREEANVFSARIGNPEAALHPNSGLAPPLPIPPHPPHIPPHPPHERPDISVLNPRSAVAPKFLIDVAIVAPLSGSESGVLKSPLPDQAPISGKMANLRSRDKVLHYRKLLTLDGPMVPMSAALRPAPLPGTSYGFEFHPFVIESTGHLPRASLQFLKHTAQDAADVHKIDADKLYRYFLKCISITLQKGISNAINKRLLQINSNSRSTLFSNLDRNVNQV
jgi:hypothetical protein